MINPNLMADIGALPPGERLELIQALWDSLDPEQVPVSASERAVLDERLDSLAQSSFPARSWDDVSDRLKRLLP